MRVYFDNAATTAISEEVIDAMLPALRQLYGNPSSIHAEGRAARAALESARKTVAQCIGAGTGEIFFTSGGTESNNMAIKCAVRDLGVQRIISSPTEHHCGTHAIETVHKIKGVEVVWLPVDERGRIDYQGPRKPTRESSLRPIAPSTKPTSRPTICSRFFRPRHDFA